MRRSLTDGFRKSINDTKLPEAFIDICCVVCFNKFKYNFKHEKLSMKSWFELSLKKAFNNLTQNQNSNCKASQFLLNSTSGNAAKQAFSTEQSGFTFCFLWKETSSLKNSWLASFKTDSKVDCHEIDSHLHTDCCFGGFCWSSRTEDLRIVYLRLL